MYTRASKRLTRLVGAVGHVVVATEDLDEPDGAAEGADGEPVLVRRVLQVRGVPGTDLRLREGGGVRDTVVDDLRGTGRPTSRSSKTGRLARGDARAARRRRRRRGGGGSGGSDGNVQCCASRAPRGSSGRCLACRTQRRAASWGRRGPRRGQPSSRTYWCLGFSVRAG